MKRVIPSFFVRTSVLVPQRITLLSPCVDRAPMRLANVGIAAPELRWQRAGTAGRELEQIDHHRARGFIIDVAPRDRVRAKLFVGRIPHRVTASVLPRESLDDAGD